MKLCVDCKWHKYNKWETDHVCHHPVFYGSPCPVTGYVPQGKDCGSERSEGIFLHHLFKRCGPKGKLWEPIPLTADPQPLTLNKDAVLGGGSGGSGIVTIVVKGDETE